MNRLLVLLLLLFLISPANAQESIESADGVLVEVSETSKIITIGGSITETVHALGFWDSVIATDQSSTYPPQVFRMPRVPYVRNLTSEGVLSLNANLIIASSDASPESAIQQIRDAGTPVLLVQDEESLDGVVHKLETIGKALNAEEAAAVLIQQNQAHFEQAETLRSTIDEKPTIMFVLETRNGGSFMVAGSNTGASSMIELAGAKNAFESFNGYRPVTNESILTANPDYVLVMQSRLEGIEEGLVSTPGVNLITAVKQDQIIAMDGNKLLGFGPRFGEAILMLMDKIHPDLNIEF